MDSAMKGEIEMDNKRQEEEAKTKRNTDHLVSIITNFQWWATGGKTDRGLVEEYLGEEEDDYINGWFEDEKMLEIIHCKQCAKTNRLLRQIARHLIDEEITDGTK